MKLFVLTTLFSVFTLMSAQAACYSRDEAEAEQGLRLHSELMVIGLNCQHLFTVNGQNMYGAYRDFTSRHEQLFAGYEDVILNYFESTGAMSPEKELNTLRTEFANRISMAVAETRPDLFCAQNAQRLSNVLGMSKTDIRYWATSQDYSSKTSRALCVAGHF